jgi:ribonuclease HI
MITIYTDGACSKNGQKDASGGFGVVVLENNKPIKFYSKRSIETTNNREELKAILYSLLNYGKHSPTVTVYSDSAYAINTLTNWMFGWARNGWIKSDKKTPENLDLIKPYYDHLNKGYKIDLVKVPGHSGVLWNEVADKLATGQLTEEDAYAKYC